MVDFCFLILTMSGKGASPLTRKKARSLPLNRGSSEPNLFSDPIFLSTKEKDKDKGKALAGSDGVNVLAKRTSKRTVSLLTGKISSSSGASTPAGNIRPDAQRGIGYGSAGGTSASANAAAKTGQSSGSGVSKRTPTAAAVGEFRSGTGLPVPPNSDNTVVDQECSGDPPSAPLSASGEVVPGQGDRVRIQALAPSPVALSSSPGAQRMDRLEAMLLLLMEDRSGRVAGSGGASSGSGIVHSGPASGSRVDNAGSGSGTAVSGSGSAGCSGLSRSGFGSSGTGTTISTSGFRISGSGFTGTDPPTGADHASGSAKASGSGFQQATQLNLAEKFADAECSSEEEELPQDLAPPVLTRELDRHEFLLQKSAHSHEDPGLEEDNATDSESALLFAGMAGVAAINRKYVSQTSLPKRPGLLGASASGTMIRRYAPSGLVSSWNNYHLNVLRGARDLGADDWTPEIRPFSQWHPALPHCVPQVRRLFRPGKPLILDPELPLPAVPSEAERALVPASKRSPQGAALISENKVLATETKMHVVAEALDVASTLSSALSEALRDPEDRDQLCQDPNVDPILTTLDALPAALSYAANAISAAMISSQISRRDCILDKADLPKASSARLRLLPPAAGSLFGPHLDSLRASTEVRTPLCVEELTKAITASAPKQAKQAKQAPSASGWGRKRKPFRQQSQADAPPFKKARGAPGFRHPPPRGRGRGRKSN